MAITNKEIIQNQLNRINRKLSTDFSLTTENDETCYLQSNRQVLFENMECYRSEEQMIEYLAGMEDAIDYFQRQKA